VALMTHAQIPHITLPTAAHYNQLAPTFQDDFDRHIADADNAANQDSFQAAVARAAHTAGIAVPPPQHGIVLCRCFNPGCGCDLIVPETADGVRVIDTPAGGNLPSLLCPTCAHDCP
jgi:hypothetical protein